MKRVLVVINHFEIGGVQKSALGYLKQLSRTCKVTALVLSMKGALLEWLPDNVTYVESKSLYRYYGMPQSACRTIKEKLLRSLMVLTARYLNVSIVRFFADKTVDELGDFDEIISYHHPAPDKEIYGGTAEYALAYAKRHPAQTACFVHCDLYQPGLNSRRCLQIYTAFQRIFCVSEGTRSRFLSTYAEKLPTLASEAERKTTVQRNIVDIDMIRQQADGEPMPSVMRKSDSDQRLTLLSVARLSHVKGIFRFVQILSSMDLSKIRYVIVGGGGESSAVEAFIHEHHLEDSILLAGDQPNPYPYMKYADMLVVPSYHEAAPVVFQEAAALSLPVFTTETLSAREMVQDGWIVGNNDDVIRKKLEEVVAAWNR